MSKKDRLLKNTLIIAIGNICTKCISFFMLPLYTSILSTEEYGSFDLVSTYSSLLMIILTLQFEQGVFRYLIESRNNYIKEKKYITNSIFSIILANILFTIILTPILIYSKYSYTLYLILISCIGSFMAIFLQIPRGLGDNTTYAIGSCINGSMQVFFNVIFIAFFKLGINGLLLSTILSMIITLLFLIIKTKIWKYFNLAFLDIFVLKELIKYSFPLIPYTLCWWIINASDRTIISIFLGTAFNGIYAAAYKFPSLFSMITNIFQLAWNESAAENSCDEKKEIFYEEIINKAIRFYSSSNLLIITIMSFIFNILIKKDFSEAYYYVPILMTAALFHSISSLYSAIYFALKETKRILLSTITAAIINIVIGVIFINELGLYATSISSFMAYLFITIMRHIDIQKKMKIIVSKKYISMEVFIYVIVLVSYYYRNIYVEVFIFLMTIIYSIYQNKIIIKDLFIIFKEKIKLH